MTPRAIARMLIRMTVVFLVVGMVGYRWPGLVLKPLGPVVRGLATLTGPYLEHLTVHHRDATVQITGELHPRLTQTDGTPLPATLGTWNKQVGPTLQILVVALCVGAAPVVSGRRRARALAVTLSATLLVCAFQLTVEIQETALRHMGHVWLPQLELAGTESNVAYFKGLEIRYRVARWIKSFNDGGGALFLAVWAGLLGYAMPGNWGGVKTRDD